MTDNKISIYVQLYYDLDFLNDIISEIYDNIHEIVIIDGPYSYCVDFLKKCNLLYDENTKPKELVDIIDKYRDKISYHYSVWEDEKEKRMFGYDKCKYNNVLLVDCDEFYLFDKKKIDKFINSNKSVANFHIYNMNRININYGNKVSVNKMFKKSKITSFQHLSYLWLIGKNKLEPQNFNNINTEQIGTIYHQTLNRTKNNNIIKYIFYTRLYYVNNNILDINKIFGYDIDYLLEKLNIPELLNVFYHSALEFIGIPNNKIMYLCDNIEIDLQKFKDNYKYAYFTKNSKILLNVNYNCYLKIKKKYKKNDIISIEINTENIKSLTVIFYELSFNKSITSHPNENINIDNDYTSININLENNTGETIGYAICINCNLTIDNNIIGTLQNIKINDVFF